MPINHVLAVVPVADFEAALAWYERLFGRPADNLPMPGLADWHVTETGWVQLFRHAERAGRSLVNFAVDDLDTYRADLMGRGLTPGPVQAVSKGVRISIMTDPEGNTITLVENVRVD